MSVIVCGQNFWPIPKQDKSCVLPEALLQGSESFQKYYDSVHSGRLLTFHPELGSVEVKARFKNRSHEITLSTHAMVVLALFEGLGEDESLSYTVRRFVSFPNCSLTVRPSRISQRRPRSARRNFDERYNRSPARNTRFSRNRQKDETSMTRTSLRTITASIVGWPRSRFRRSRTR